MVWFGNSKYGSVDPTMDGSNLIQRYDMCDGLVQVQVESLRFDFSSVQMFVLIGRVPFDSKIRSSTSST